MSEPTQDYPLGGSLEPYDIERDVERDKELTECTCQYYDAKEVINESGLIHNRNCPAGKK